jgi:Collagen triple helix repeat (20 copies)
MDQPLTREQEELHFGNTLADKQKSKSVVRMVGFVGEPSEPLPIADEAPAIWHINRLQTDEEGDPLMEGIFSNYNDDIVHEVDSGTVVGRFSPARGPAERIEVVHPLWIRDGTLGSDATGGGEEGPPGPQGPPGPPGETGPAGASSSMWFYRTDSGTTAADPGAGRYRYNNYAQQNLATLLYVDRLTVDGLDPTAVFTLATFDDEFIIQEKGLAAHYQKWKMLGPAVPLGGGDYFQLPVQFTSQQGASFANNQNVTFLLRTKGQKGDKGDKGDVGPQGPQGSIGPAGPQGPVGGMGPVGPQGPKGDTGAQGIQGNAGPQGIKGDKGDTGSQGPQGVKGNTGDTGQTGLQGPQGVQGVKGDTGDQGVPGPPGGLGEAPVDGKIYGRSDAVWTEVTGGGATIAIADDPPTSPVHGDLWFEATSGNTFIFFDDGSSQQWVRQNTGVGPPGARGPAGPQGTAGAASTVPGPQGVAGPQGPKGDTGTTGAQSIVPGPQGPPGIWTQVTQAQYNALAPPNPTTLYVIIG